MIQSIIQSKAISIDLYCDSEADLHGPKEHADELAEAYEEVHLVDSPYAASFSDVNQSREAGRMAEASTAMGV
jgi:hypothetical protein